MSWTIKAVLGLVVVLGVAAGVGADPNIIVGTHHLNANQPGQTIPIYVTGAESVEGLEFRARIGGGTSGPTFEYVDILTGAIFGGNNTGVNFYLGGYYIDPRDVYVGTTTSSGSVLADGLLATLIIDTTGLFDGQYSLSLINTLEGPTDFAGVSADIADGSIVVPEPTSLVIMLVGAGMVVRRRRNKSRH